MELPLGREFELPFGGGFLSINWLKSDDPDNICANFKEEQEHIFEICDWDGDLLAPFGTLSSLCVRNWRPGMSF